MATVAIVSLGRARAMGEVRRVKSWRSIFEAAGATVEEITVEKTRFDVRGVPTVVAGNAAPERLAWSGRRLRSDLDRIQPDTVVAVSSRTYDAAAFAGCQSLVLDFVDHLSRSYRDRGDITGGASRFAYRALALAHDRVERHLKDVPAVRVAAGWGDALRLDATWIPIVDSPASVAEGLGEADRDVLFFGTLRYPPNVEALDRLARMWPAVLASRPETTALVAGSRPTDHVRELCATHGWELVSDYPDLGQILGRARVSVVPLTHTAGIQIKVLEAAGYGMAQVVTSAALDGFGPGFPLTPADDDDAFVAEMVRLLEDPRSASEQGERAREHVAETYRPEAWCDWAATVVKNAVHSTS